MVGEEDSSQAEHRAVRSGMEKGVIGASCVSLLIWISYPLLPIGIGWLVLLILLGAVLSSITAIAGAVYWWFAKGRRSRLFVAAVIVSVVLAWTFLAMLWRMQGGA